MRSKLTYANVTATLALFLALGGSSYAVVQFTGRNVKDGSPTTKDVKNRSLLRKVRRGQLEAGSKGDTGDRGPQGVQGVQGEAGSAAAYASADGDGTLIESKNVDRIARGGFGSPTVGYYCLHTTVTPHNVVATVKGVAPGRVVAEYYPAGVHCTTPTDAGYNLEVFTSTSSGTAADRDFMLIVN